MMEALAGKWVWVWNWRRCDGGDPAKVAARLRTAGCRGVLIKAHDGPLRFDQGRPWHEIAAALKAEGLATGGWAFTEYHILRPDALIDDLTLSQFVVPALVIMFATGFLEEFIFRGILQRLAEGFLGRSGFLYVSLIFAILHIGYRSATDFLFVLAIALLYGWVVRRTGSIMGVSVSHGITNITLFLVMPFVPVLAAQPDWLPPLK